jgi:hypothetical protein
MPHTLRVSVVEAGSAFAWSAGQWVRFERCVVAPIDLDAWHQALEIGSSYDRSYHRSAAALNILELR